ncbi:MAG: hypothetical protein ACTHMP_16940 [Thermomicrobiales bacterium]
MPNRVTKGRALVGSLRDKKGGLGQFAKVASVTRTMTTATTLFTLPADAQLIGLTINGAAVSNAGTTATLSIGKVGGNGHDYLNGFDVNGATGSGQQVPSAATLPSAALTADTGITATYAETGTASTSGGPWQVVVEYVV